MDIDTCLARLEELCSAFKQSMLMDHIPYSAKITFKRYLDMIVDDYEKNQHISPLSYSIDLLRDLYTMCHPELLFDKKQDVSIECWFSEEFKHAEQPLYAQSLKFSKTFLQSVHQLIYIDYLTEIYLFLSSRLTNFNIELKEDFTAEFKIKAKVTFPQIENVIKLLQNKGYIDNDNETRQAFLSLFEGYILARQTMKIPWKFMSKTSGLPNKPTQNIAALYVLFDTLGVDLTKSYNKKIIEGVFLNEGEIKKRPMSDLLNRFKNEIEQSLKIGLVP